MLATSREPLAIAGEARYRLSPLTLPDLDDLAGAAQTEAVALFADRARSADRHFALDEQTGPVVARLVARLDGMPLAIELAAARVEALGVTQLLDRLGDRFALLAGTDRTAPSRQRSLAATVEWSYQLLEEDERRVFRAVSVFPGPFALDAAEAVAGPGAGPAVLHLVDCSLLVPPRPGPDGRSRYLMLETLRAYGTRLLAQAGEQDQAQVALAGYAASVAGEAGAGLQVITGELAAARWLDAEDATMAHVLGWAVGHDLDTAARLVTALSMWWVLRGRLAGQEPLLRELAGRAEAGSEGWCAAEFWLARTAFDAADLPGALQRCVAVIDVIGDREPSRLLVDCLDMQSAILSSLAGLRRRPRSAAAPWPWPGSWVTRSARRLPRMPWPSRPGTTATWTMPSSWPGRPGRSRTSPARPPGYAATCWPRRWPMRGTWPPPNRPAPPHWLVPGTQATCITWANC